MRALDIRVPGDKSIAHRALILGALAAGESVIQNVPAGHDVLATEACLRALGVAVDRASGRARIAGDGVAGLRAPAEPLDCLNSGTTMRLLSGVLAGSSVSAGLTGDASLQRRPMARVIDPLRAMGARIRSRDGMPPLWIEGQRLTGRDHRLPTPSAQVKSALLLAGLTAAGPTSVEEPVPTRDHTERLMRAMGAQILNDDGVVCLQPITAPLQPLQFAIPGDLSSAAFWLAAAAMRPGWSVRVLEVGLNPTRTRFLRILESMGAAVRIEEIPGIAIEPMGDVTVTGGTLRPLHIGDKEVAEAIDEIPILMLAATQADGTSSIDGAAELRVKESDRLRAMADGLHRMGVDVEEFPDGVRITGPAVLRPAVVDAYGDHRVAMALAIAGLLGDRPTEIIGAESASVSYPGFFKQLAIVARG
ncbi:MAG: 3-phosphoshikimate 1-carboxyvinyltransferase [Candidatus Dormibacteraeota bacterium]|nr:3-phosphoshikimate 1-carboxyvinyltransferase [Candidatus Dormibacteraeota bacterium]